jgi:hypothetical protein
MLKVLKQMFCKHIWQTLSTTLLGYYRDRNGRTGLGGLPTYSNYIRYASSENCVKCNKYMIVEKRVESIRD